MTITIIGSGKVGASAALNCGLRELDRDILLLDIVQGLPQGEAMDINHQLSERGSDSVARGSNNYEDMRGTDYVVLVAGVGRKPGMTRMDLLKTNAGIVKDVAGKIASYAKDATIVVVTNPLDPMTHLALKGATVYAPGNAVATMLESAIRDKKLVIPVSALLEGEYGVSDLCIGVPAVIGAGGVERVIELKLDSFEQDIFDKGITSVKEAIKALPL